MKRQEISIRLYLNISIEKHTQKQSCLQKNAVSILMVSVVVRETLTLLAIAPNASSGIILSTSPSIEPLKANAYTHRTRAGSFLVKNKYLTDNSLKRRVRTTIQTGLLLLRIKVPYNIYLSLQKERKQSSRPHKS